MDRVRIVVDGVRKDRCITCTQVEERVPPSRRRGQSAGKRGAWEQRAEDVQNRQRQFLYRDAAFVNEI